MALPHIGADTGDSAIVAVTIGAFLATGGGFLASRLEHRAHRREAERASALLFGEILSALKLILALADETRSRGDPYGPITMRMIRAAQREAQTYDRNRESLFNLGDAYLRASIHILLIRLSLALDGVAEAAEGVNTMEMRIHAGAPSDSALRDFADRRDRCIQDRKGSFDFAVETRQEIQPLLDKLQKIAKYTFEAHETVVRRDLNAQLTQNTA